MKYLFALLLGLLVACDGKPASTSSSPVLVASTSIIADWMQELLGESARVDSLVGRGRDPHTYRPTTREAGALEDAALVVHLGLSFDERLVAAAPAERRLSLAAALPAERLLYGACSHPDHAQGGEHTHAHLIDPHVWMDPELVRLMLPALSRRLQELLPAQAAAIAARTAAYSEELHGAGEQLRQQMQAIPAARRRVVSIHQAWSYFGRAFGLELVGDLLGSLSTEVADPAPQTLARLVDSMRKQQVAAILVEDGAARRLAAAVAAETGAALIEGLRVGSLGPAEGPAGTYLGLLRENVRVLAEALQ